MYQMFSWFLNIINIRLFNTMTTTKKNWIDEESDGSEDEYVVDQPETAKKEEDWTKETSEEPKRQYKPRENNRDNNNRDNNKDNNNRDNNREYKGNRDNRDNKDRNEERARFKQQQLKQIDELTGENIWLFVFKRDQGPNEELDEAVKEVECLKNFQGEKGYDILLSKDNARKLIRDGFRPNKVFAKVVVGKKNYRERERDYEEGDRYERRDNRGGNREGGHRRKYVEKDEGAKSEFTFQKKQRRNEDDPEQREKDRERKQADKYKNDPLYQGLGNFRNKEAVNKETVKEVETKEVPNKEVPNKQISRKEAPITKQFEILRRPAEEKKIEDKKVEDVKVQEKKVQEKKVYQTATSTRNKYKEKEVRETKPPKSSSSEKSPENLTPYTRQQQKKPQKPVNKGPKRSNNPFDAFD